MTNFELNGDKIGWKNARTGDSVSPDFLDNELAGRISDPVGKPTQVFKRVQ